MCKVNACKFRSKGVLSVVCVCVCFAVGDCEGVRALLTATQERIQGKPKAIARHVPTRFAVLHLVGMDILKSEDSLKAMVSASHFFL